MLVGYMRGRSGRSTGDRSWSRRSRSSWSRSRYTAGSSGSRCRSCWSIGSWSVDSWCAGNWSWSSRSSSGRGCGSCRGRSGGALGYRGGRGGVNCGRGRRALYIPILMQCACGEKLLVRDDLFTRSDMSSRGYGCLRHHLLKELLSRRLVRETSVPCFREEPGKLLHVPVAAKHDAFPPSYP